jgi:UDP-glucuronate 4-epimerase
MFTYLITGAAGFIGYHVAERLATQGEIVVGVDNLNPYYDVQLKRARLERLLRHANFSFIHIELDDADAVRTLFRDHSFDYVVHLAAQPGVRYSLVNPHAYVNANVVGFLNVLEGCRFGSVRHLVFASSSSVYGANARLPFSTHDGADHPVSLYAATKKAGEMMAHAYAHLYGVPCTGLRLFTVYGPWGRPDMMPMLFARAILEGKPIDLYNHGKHKRDFTYIDDVVEGIVRIIPVVPQTDHAWNAGAPDPATSAAPYRLYNIGNHTAIEVLHFIKLLEAALGRRAIMNMLPAQAGDLPETYADVDDLARVTGFAPSTSLEIGIQKFVDWYCEYYVETVTTEPQTPNPEPRTSKSVPEP